MSAWPGKYVIGLTGNIATGKSVVRKMMEHLGAYGIDADALAHRAIAKDAPGYHPVVELFGKWILGPDGQIDRARLGRIVFADPEALARLEAIVHPLVEQAVDVLVRRASQKVVVIEAIKLLEGKLRFYCDSIWVTYVPEEVQQARLVEKRGMSAAVARQRIQAQLPQDDKLAAADVVIRNDGSFEESWRQILASWQKLFPDSMAGPEPAVTAERGQLAVERAGPRQAGEIASLVTRLSNQRKRMTRAAVMAAFGEKAFLLLMKDGKVVGLAGWQVENLVARVDDVYLEHGLPMAEAMRVLMEEIERASRELQCEALLLFLPPQLARQEAVWRDLHYEPRTVLTLGVRAWQEAATESMPAGTVLLFKQLRKDRVLRPV
jgi:dephospho-CoA kinase